MMDGKLERLQYKHLFFAATSENTRRQLKVCNALNHYTGTVTDLCINLWRATFVSNLSKKPASVPFCRINGKFTLLFIRKHHGHLDANQ